MTRVCARLAVIAAGVVLMAGCGGDSSSTGPNAATDNPAATNAGGPSAAPATKPKSVGRTPK